MSVGTVPYNWLLVWMHFHKIKQKKEKIITLFPFFLCWFVVLLLQLLLLLFAGGWLSSAAQRRYNFSVYIFYSQLFAQCNIRENYFRFKLKKKRRLLLFSVQFLRFAIKTRTTNGNSLFFVCAEQHLCVRFDGTSALKNEKLKLLSLDVADLAQFLFLFNSSLDCFFAEEKNYFFFGCCWLFPNAFGNSTFHTIEFDDFFSRLPMVQIQFGKIFSVFGSSQVFLCCQLFQLDDGELLFDLFLCF